MNEAERNFLNNIADGIERQDRRNWPPAIGEGPLRRSDTVKRVANVLAEHKSAMLSKDDPGKDFFEGLSAAEEFFTALPPPEDELVRVIEASSSDFYAYQVLRLIEFLSFGRGSDAFRKWRSRMYAGVWVAPPRPPGASRYKNAHRRMIIVGQIEQLANAGFSPTRNEATSSRNSGCDIVVEAAKVAGIKGMTYFAAVEIWKKRHQRTGYKLVGQMLLEFVLEKLDMVDTVLD